MTRRFIRIGCFISIIIIGLPLLVLLLIFLLFILSRGHEDCYVESREIFPSPDHTWTAVVEFHGCVQWIFVAGLWHEVYLVTEKPVPLQVIPILTTVYSPEIIWSAPNVLQIWVPWPEKFDLWVRNANGVRIDMRYDTSLIDEGAKKPR